MGTTNTILLTAAITPDPRFGSAVSDPSERLGEYRKAVKKWQAQGREAGFDVAVIETTGSDALDADVKVIPFTPSDEHVSRGKGSVEAAALDHALSVLALAREATVVKVTGRLVVENADRLLSPLAPGVIQVRRTLDRSFCNTRLLISTAGFWTDHLSGMDSSIDDNLGRYIEHIVAYRLITAELFAKAKVERFPVRPVFEGRSGTNGTPYGTTRERIVSPILAKLEALLHPFGSKQV